MNATEKILQTYNKEELKEIANHGCQSGVCSQHIYYGDTIKFYDNHEDEIMDYFTDNYDKDFLVTLFKQSEAILDYYKNYVTWAYIEAVSFDVISDTESLLQPA